MGSLKTTRKVDRVGMPVVAGLAGSVRTMTGRREAGTTAVYRRDGPWNVSTTMRKESPVRAPIRTGSNPPLATVMVASAFVRRFLIEALRPTPNVPDGSDTNATLVAALGIACVAFETTPTHSG